VDNLYHTPILDDGSLADLRRRIAEAHGGDADRWIGQQVRDLRKSRRMSLPQLSRASGLSTGLLSQIERGSSSLSLRSLLALSRSLGVQPMWFFNDGIIPPAREHGTVVRQGAGRRLELPSKGLLKELMTPDLSGALQMLLVTLEPGGSTGSDTYSHPGEECGYLLEGELRLWVDGELFQLRSGDAFRFDSTKPHKSLNPGTKPARILWITTPPVYCAQRDAAPAGGPGPGGLRDGDVDAT